MSIESILEEWDEIHRALVGAFDTPVARRAQSDEFAEDARNRLRLFDERIRQELSDKTFLFTFRGGKQEQGRGRDVADAFRRLGYGGGAIHSLDSYQLLDTNLISGVQPGEAQTVWSPASNEQSEARLDRSPASTTEVCDDRR